MTFGKPFEPGREKTGGRKLGVRNRLSERFLRDLHDEWKRSGPDTMKILAKENPEAFARLALGILPKEFNGEVNGTVHHIVTGVPRGDEMPSAGTPTFRAPPAALPEPSPTNFVLEGDAPKEPSPAELARAKALEGVEPKWDAVPEPPKTEKLIYPPIIKRIGWR
jgi:hypothetical protein